MAHTKAIGSTKLGRDSIAKRLGIKINDGQKAMVGQIIIRQRGTKYLPGTGVIRADDDTLYAGKNGVVKFASKTKTKFGWFTAFGDDGKRSVSSVVRFK